ncbi:MBL fold metallo-hydrolase [Candidatus Marinimicrobia bacterium MT.SAG.2]|nr:MBL fold metallo-hydrolase [Candidatus Neomarinimicrobiota bacterium]TFB09924.1 MBL fold metallo-hydrolase [Candidatus Marinimicrobia bacterium MT.SAG.2]
MQLGRYTVSAIECGELSLDGGAMFGVVPKTLWQKTNPADEQNRIKMAMRAMLIQGDGKNIIVDCGAGNKLSEKLKGIYDLDFSEYSLESSVSRSGLKFEDITDVVLTHLHFDHTGGATVTDDNGGVKATFPNATYYIHQVQWDTAFNPSLRDKASYFKENYEILMKDDRLNLLEGEGELFPEIETIVVNGHTPGMILLKIKSGERTMLYSADLFPTSSHVPIPYIMAYDLEPLESMKEKERVLEQAVKEDWILFYEHDPYKVATGVTCDEKGYRAGEELSL